MTALATLPDDEALGVVVLVGPWGSPDTVAWAGEWAAAGGQRLTVVRPGAEDPARLVARAGLRASSIVVDAEVAARASGRAGGPPFAPHCPVLVVPPVLADAGPDAEVWVAAGPCDGCAVTLGFAHAYAARVGAPLRVGVWGGAFGPDARSAHEWLARFAVCYPGLRVTLDDGPHPGRPALRERPRLLIAGLLRPDAAGLGPRPGRVASGLRRPVALVPAAA